MINATTKCVSPFLPMRRVAFRLLTGSDWDQRLQGFPVPEALRVLKIVEKSEQN